MNLERLISRSLSTPRQVTAGMRASLRDNPTKALRFGQLVDHLSDFMRRAYKQQHQRFATLNRDSERAAHSEFRRKAREVLTQFQVSTNRELKRVYFQHIRNGASHSMATKQVLRRFRTLGVTPPASTRLQSLYNNALRAAASQGLLDATIRNQSVWGFRWICKLDERLRDDHAQFNRVTLEKSNPFWLRYQIPLSYNCRCKLKVFKRPQPIVEPPRIIMEIENGFEGSGFDLR